MVAGGPLNKPPLIKNILDVGKTLRPGTLIHFSDEQWKQMTGKLREGKAVPKFGIGIECYPMPGGGFLGRPICIQYPCEVCRPVVMGREPDGSVIFECFCQRDPKCPEDPPTPIPPPPGTCALQIRRIGGRLQLACVRQTCTGTCRLQIVRQRVGYLLTCMCS
jgi:hypothetical protein